MQKYSDVLFGDTGVVSRPLAGASVLVRTHGGGTASIYSDNGVTPADNPLTADSEGRFSFYAADGRYDLTVSAAGYNSYTVSDVLLEDPNDNPSGVWTPSISFATPGDLDIIQPVQIGSYIRLGQMVFCQFEVDTSTFTHTTASGELRITGLPYVPASVGTYASGHGVVSYQGITSSRSQLGLMIANGMVIIEASGSGMSRAIIGAGNTTSGVNIELLGSFVYMAEP